MGLVFMGTPDFAVPSLRALVKAGYDVVGVFTQPDRPAGRGKKLKPSPVKSAAEEMGLAVFQPEKIKSPEGLALLRDLAPERIIVVAYGQILSPEILKLPAQGCINVHASLLPFYRGAAPIHWAVMRGETQTGVTTMLMDEGLDTGGILLKQAVPIADETTTGELHDQLAVLGGELLVTTLQELEAGNLWAVPQSGEWSYAPLLKREHEQLDWFRGAVELDRQVRGLNPWPGAFTVFRDETLKVWRSALCRLPDIDGEDGSFSRESELKKEPGQILQLLEDGLVVQTGEGLLHILEVQPAGKRSMSAKDFFNGRRGRSGEFFA